MVGLLLGCPHQTCSLRVFAIFETHSPCILRLAIGAERPVVCSHDGGLDAFCTLRHRWLVVQLEKINTWSCRGFHQWHPNSWIVYFTDNPTIQLMI
jgi:hypothetical protein